MDEEFVGRDLYEAQRAEIDRLTAEVANLSRALDAGSRRHRATLEGCCVALGIPGGDPTEPSVFEAIRRLRAQGEK